MRTVIILLSIVLSSIAGTQTVMASSTQTIDITNNPIALMTGDGVTENNNALQTILDSANNYSHTNIIVPKGRYLLNGYVYMRSNITFTFDKGASFVTNRGVNYIYLSSTPGYESGVQNVTWNNAHFSSIDGVGRVSSSIFHGKNITHNGTVWNRALCNGCHLLDIMGSTNITVRDFKVIGAADEYTKTDKEKIYSEAFQIDYATRGSIGPGGAKLMESTPETFDGLPSRNITIENGQFLPAYDNRGALLSLAPTPFGSHGNVNNQPAPHDIVFRNNYILDPVPVSQRGNPAVKGVLHFYSTKNMTIENNTFEYKDAPANDYLFSFRSFGNINIQPTENIIIRNNTIKNIIPNNSYLLFEVENIQHSRPLIRNIVISDNHFFLKSIADRKPLIETVGDDSIEAVTERDNHFKLLDNYSKQSVKNSEDNTPVVGVPNTGNVSLEVSWASFMVLPVIGTVFLLIRNRGRY